MKHDDAHVPPAPLGQVDRGVWPRAWWRESTLPECRPCVTTCEEEAQQWRDEGHAVRELGDVAAERARVADGMRGLVRLLRLPDAPQYLGDERHTERRVLLALADATMADSWPNVAGNRPP